MRTMLQLENWNPAGCSFKNGILQVVALKIGILQVAALKIKILQVAALKKESCIGQV